ncbi:flagellar biosynthetic protein FliO, partial [Aquibium sp. A9E412]|uniref:flagellar biosynthetic protein FliO n=1 Tax=Aquibium sp. A9E412 TaxID=2976767 RepID=UPI0025AFEDB6
MREWFVGVVGESYASAVMWTLGALLLLFLVLLAVRLMRRVGGRGFAPGGRHRKPRLAVTDAVSLDNNRRLLLVRRDDVEHLVMIGGPSDIVVERAIRPEPPAPARAEADVVVRHPGRKAEP